MPQTNDNGDNQLSTVLLLIALGTLIYFLTKPKNTIMCKNNTNSNNQETASKPASRKSVPPKPVPPKPVAESIPNPAPVPIQDPVLMTNQVDNSNSSLLEEPVLQESFASITPDNGTSTDTGALLDEAFNPPIPQQSNESNGAVDINKQNLVEYDSKQFLPEELNEEWFDTDFSLTKYNINDDKLINTDRYVIGVNTVGQSLKNAAYDIRGTIPNPKFTISPWNNSTYEPDFNIKSLC